MQTNDIAQLVQQVESWPVPLRIALARQILESVEREPESPPAVPRGPSAAEIAARFQTEKPAPNDEEVEQWLDAHRATKYRS